MAEGSDALLEQLECQDAGTRGPWSAHGCQVSEPNSTLAWARDVLQLEWRYTIRHRTGSVARTHEHRGRRRLVEALAMLWNRWGLFRPLFPLGGGIDPMHSPGQAHNQNAAKAVRSATTEPTKLDWMRMMRLAKFLVTHDELEWLYHAQDVPEKYVVHGDSDSAGSGTRRSTSGTLNSLDSIPLNSAKSSRAERLSCTPQGAQQHEGCSQCSCWSRPD